MKSVEYCTLQSVNACGYEKLISNTVVEEYLFKKTIKLVTDGVRKLKALLNATF